MIEDYALSSKELYEFLTENGVTHLHHANTLLTSVNLIKAGFLVSRKFVEDHPDLHQTPQPSDDKDKFHDVWDSTFVDGTDHHLIFRGRNLYGPVLFKMKLDLLLSEDLDQVYITRSNPIYWPDGKPYPDERKFYGSMEDVKKDYSFGKKREDAQIMFTFRSPGAKIDFDKYLDEIWYDDPKMRVPFRGGEKEGRDVLKLALETALEKYGRRHYR
ncbi:MAG: hypothetical protein EOO20_12240 [Chryseobacterium sp.]|nr:MAG: hypothetical protein EOO20_12240 [Chryseobacterium sp.]